MGKKRSKVWKLVPVCIFWTVWKERNRLAFRNESLAVQRLKHYFVFNLWVWNNMYIGEEISSLIGLWSGWLQNEGLVCSLPLFFVLFFGLCILHAFSWLIYQIYIYIYIYMFRFVEGPLMSNKIGFLVGNGRSRDFGRASCMVTLLCVIPSPLCMLWWIEKRCGW